MTGRRCCFCCFYRRRFWQLLISLVADGLSSLQQYEMTKSLLFALSCSAFWVGMLNAIQERSVKDERLSEARVYDRAVPDGPYVSSKAARAGQCCRAIQSALLAGAFSLY